MASPGPRKRPAGDDAAASAGAHDASPALPPPKRASHGGMTTAGASTAPVCVDLTASPASGGAAGGAGGAAGLENETPRCPVCCAPLGRLDAAARAAHANACLDAKGAPLRPAGGGGGGREASGSGGALRGALRLLSSACAACGRDLSCKTATARAAHVRKCGAAPQRNAATVPQPPPPLPPPAPPPRRVHRAASPPPAAQLPPPPALVAGGPASLASWLSSLGLAPLLPLFDAQRLSLAEVPMLRDADLCAMAVARLSDRRALLAAAARMPRPRASPPRGRARAATPPRLAAAGGSQPPGPDVAALAAAVSAPPPVPAVPQMRLRPPPPAMARGALAPPPPLLGEREALEAVLRRDDVARAGDDGAGDAAFSCTPQLRGSALAERAAPPEGCRLWPLQSGAAPPPVTTAAALDVDDVEAEGPSPRQQPRLSSPVSQRAALAAFRAAAAALHAPPAAEPAPAVSPGRRERLRNGFGALRAALQTLAEEGVALHAGGMAWLDERCADGDADAPPWTD
jgi:hypothetical protein